ncbi:hypothetical protein FRC04_002992 [Tulasnella sp. 424]|nr:hypothetical protein FRC04_002992 [Tulasnella sp. 424]KAG8981205.1 hypothetical protein FRC05_004107 [Tulasnella sp. 425]
MTKSTQPIVLFFAIAGTVVWLAKTFAPDLVYDSPPANWFSQVAGLERLGTMTPDREPVQGIVVCLNFAIVAFIWLAALSSKRDFHLAVAILGMSFGLASAVTCAISPNYGSGVLLFGAVPNFFSGLAVFVLGGFGWKDLLSADDEGAKNYVKKEL